MGFSNSIEHGRLRVPMWPLSYCVHACGCRREARRENVHDQVTSAITAWTVPEGPCMDARAVRAKGACR